jgi:hypothetical protein
MEPAVKDTCMQFWPAINVCMCDHARACAYSLSLKWSQIHAFNVNNDHRSTLVAYEQEEQWGKMLGYYDTSRESCCSYTQNITCMYLYVYTMYICVCGSILLLITEASNRAWCGANLIHLVVCACVCLRCLGIACVSHHEGLCMYTYV